MVTYELIRTDNGNHIDSTRIRLGDKNLAYINDLEKAKKRQLQPISNIM